jgi:hypothetical protein
MPLLLVESFWRPAPVNRRRQRCQLGFADVTAATFTVISHESDHAEGKIPAGEGCTGFVTVRLAFEK